MISRMQENGWLRKERSQKDERKVFIYLEEKARCHQASITKKVSEEIELCRISASEYKELMDRLNKLHQKLRERTNTAGA
jgi:DNA-binding MarR family transcriptional regulator